MSATAAVAALVFKVNRYLRKLQWHSDGGARGSDHAACACTLTLLSNGADGNFQRCLMFAQALYLGNAVGSTQAEISALRSAMTSFNALMTVLTKT